MGGKTCEEYIQAGFENTGAAEEDDLRGVQGEAVLRRSPRRRTGRTCRWACRSSTTTPRATRCRTPSGKLEYYSTTLAQMFPDDKRARPRPALDRRGRRAIRSASTWSAAGRTRSCSCRTIRAGACTRNLDDVTWFREMEEYVQGDRPRRLQVRARVGATHATPSVLGLETGDIVKLYNERGAVMGGVRVTERIMPGVGVPGPRRRVDSIVLGAWRPRPRRREQPHRAVRPPRRRTRPAR